MSGPKRDRFYRYLAERDGEYCWIGGEKLTKSTAVIDHWNNDNTDESEDNLHLLCHSMNAVKNPRGRAKKIQSSVCGCEESAEKLKRIEIPRVLSAELEKSTEDQPRFRHWLFQLIMKQHRARYEMVVDTGAEFAHCSQETVKRYVKKVISDQGIYRIVEDEETKVNLIELKPEWDTFRKKIEEEKKLDEQAKNWKKAKAEPC